MGFDPDVFRKMEIFPDPFCPLSDVLFSAPGAGNAPYGRTGRPLPIGDPGLGVCGIGTVWIFWFPVGAFGASSY